MAGQDIQLKITAETSGLQEAFSRLKNTLAGVGLDAAKNATQAGLAAAGLRQVAENTARAIEASGKSGAAANADWLRSIEATKKGLNDARAHLTATQKEAQQLALALGKSGPPTFAMTLQMDKARAAVLRAKQAVVEQVAAVQTLRKGYEQTKQAASQVVPPSQGNAKTTPSASGSGLEAGGGSFGKTREGVQSISRALETMQRLWIGVQAAQAAFASFQGLTQRMDDYANLSGRLKLVTNGSKEFAVAQGEIFRIAQQTQAPLIETGALYSRMAQAMTAMGQSQARTVAVTEAVALGLRISGATATEAGSAMIQLSQALASGTLRGEEFNSVNEAAPRLMQVLSDELGVTKGALRQMAEEGKLTSEVVAGALANSVDRLRREAEALPQTVGGAITQLNNAFTQFLGTSEAAGGAVAVLVDGLKAVANYLPEIASAALVAGLLAVAVTVGKVAGAMTAAAAAAGTMTAAVGALRVALAFLGGPVGLAVSAAVALGGAAYALFSDSTSELERLARAQAEGKAGTDAVTEAQKRQTDEIKKTSEELAKMEKEYEKIKRKAARNPNDSDDQAELAKETKVIEIARRNEAIKRRDASESYAQQKRLESELEEATKKRSSVQQELAKKTAEIQKKASKEAADAQIADQQALAEAMKKNQAEQLERAKKLQDDAKKLSEDAKGLRDSAAGRRETSELNRIEDPEEKQGEINRRLREQLDEAEKLNDWALSEKFAGRNDAAGKLAEQAEKAAKAAERYANMLDNADDKNEALAKAEEVQAKSKDVQAEQKKAEADQAVAAAKTFGQALEEATQKLTALKEEAKQLAITADTAEAVGKISELDAQIAALDGKVITVKAQVKKEFGNLDGGETPPAATDTAKGYASGGRLVGPGTPTSDSIPIWGSRDEFMVKASSAGKVGYDVLNFINRYGKLPDWPRFADGGRIGDAVGRTMSQASAALSARAANAGGSVQANFTFPGLGSFPATVSKAVATELEKMLSMEALKRGRR